MSAGGVADLCRVTGYSPHNTSDLMTEPTKNAPSPERGAIKQCIAYCFGKMWANRGSNYLPERVDTAAESELAALEAEIGVLRAQLSRRDEDAELLDYLEDNGGFSLDDKGIGMSMSRWGRNNTLTLREAIRAARVSADASKERKDVV